MAAEELEAIKAKYAGRFEVILEPGDNFSLKCIKCGAAAQGKRVAHPIWDGPFPCSGSGRCHYETVPYCPNCERDPRDELF